MPTIPVLPAQSILVDLDLDRVALCNQGANSRAHILLTKRKENVSMPKTFEELMAILEPAHAEVIKNHLADVVKTKDEDIAKLNTQVDTLTGEVETLKETAKSASATNDKDDILKGVSPEIAAYIGELQKSVNTLVEDKAEAIAKQRFDAVKAIPMEEETLKSVLKTASPAVFEVLKAAATAVEGAVLTAKGKDLDSDTFVADRDGAYAKLEKSARDIMKENTSITFEQAFMEACSKDSVTYAKYVGKGV